MLMMDTECQKIAAVNGWIITRHGKVSDSITVALHNSHTECWDCLETIYKFVCVCIYMSFVTLRTVHPATQWHVPEHLNVERNVRTVQLK